MKKTFDGVEAFKNELRNLKYYRYRLDKEKEKLELIFYKLTGFKGIDPSKQRLAFNKGAIEQERLEQIENYNDQLEIVKYHEQQIISIENMLNEMNPKVSEICIEVYCNKKTYKQLEKELFADDATLLKRVNKEILAAINKHAYQ